MAKPDKPKPDTDLPTRLSDLDDDSILVVFKGKGERQSDDEPDTVEAAPQRSGQLFQCGPYRPIDTPSSFDTPETRYRYRVALHEAGHGIGSLIVGREVKALMVTSINSGARGTAFTDTSYGENAAIVDLAGIAAEQLLAGADDCHPGATTDIRNARENLRSDGLAEWQIEGVMRAIHAELQRLFATFWRNGLVTVAEKLARVGVLDWENFLYLLTHGQKDAYLADPLRKSREALLASEGDVLAKALHRMAQVDKLHKAIDTPGLTALEVSKLEAQRNRLEARAVRVK